MDYIYIDKNVPCINIINNSVKSNIIIIDSYNDIDFKQSIDRIGIMFKYSGFCNVPFVDNSNSDISVINKFYSNNIMNLFTDLSNNNQKNTKIDIISCNFNSDEFINATNDIMNKYNLCINYSLDKTGNHGGNWILESSNENIKNIYFTNNINNWNNVLDDIVINDTNIASFVDHPQNIIFDDVNKIISLTSDIQFYNSSNHGYFNLSSGYVFDGNDFTITVIPHDDLLEGTSTINYTGLFTINITDTNTTNPIIQNLNIILSNDAVIDTNSGGFIRSHQNNFSVYNCSLSNNIINNSSIGGIAGSYCGIVYREDSSIIEIYNCTINIVTSPYMGGIIGGHSITTYDTQSSLNESYIDIDNCIVNIIDNSNTTSNTGGMIGNTSCNCYGGLCDVQIKNSEINYMAAIQNNDTYGILSNSCGISNISQYASNCNINIYNCIVNVNENINTNNFSGIIGQSSIICYGDNNTLNCNITNCKVQINGDMNGSLNSGFIGVSSFSGNPNTNILINNCILNLNGDLNGNSGLFSMSVNNIANYVTTQCVIYVSNCNINIQTITNGNCISGDSCDNINISNCIIDVSNVTGNAYVFGSDNHNITINSVYDISSQLIVCNSGYDTVLYDDMFVTDETTLKSVTSIRPTNYDFYQDNGNYYVNNNISNVLNTTDIPLNKFICPLSIIPTLTNDLSSISLNINNNWIQQLPQNNYIVLQMDPSGSSFSSHVGFEFTLPIEGASDLQLIYYNGSTETIIPSTNTSSQDQYYILDNNIITVYTNHFSKFLINYTHVPCIGHDSHILMADGTYKKIINIKRGDLVQCRNEILPVSRVKYTKFNTDVYCNYCIMPENTIINNTKLFKPLLITGYHPILIDNKRIPIEHIKFSLKNGIYDIYLNCKSQMISKDILLCDLQFDKPTYYNANGIWIQSSSPYTKNNPLPYELYWNESYYSNKLTTDDPEFYKEPLITYNIYNNKHIKIIK